MNRWGIHGFVFRRNILWILIRIRLRPLRLIPTMALNTPSSGFILYLSLCRALGHR